MIGEEVAYYASTIISVAMAGRLGGFALGAFSLSHAVTNITGEPRPWKRSALSPPPALYCNQPTMPTLQASRC